MQLRTRLAELPDDPGAKSVRLAAKDVVGPLTKGSASAAELDEAKRVLEQVLRIAFDSRDSV